MSLVLTFVGLFAAITVLLWSASVLIQPYLYSAPADRLPLRAAVGGMVLAAFLTFWAYVNTRADSPDKYGTFFEFNPTGTKDVAAFDAVRRLNRKGPDGNWAEETVAFRRPPGRASHEFEEVGHPDHHYRPNSATYMTVAVLVPEKEGGEKTRFDAVLDSRGQSYKSGEKVFVEQRGRRYIEVDSPGKLYAPSRWAVVGAVLLNLAHFGMWFLVLGVVMKYEAGTAFIGTVSLGLLTMLAVMPLVFNSNRPPAVAPAAEVARPS